MTDPSGQKDNSSPDTEPVVSKPYIMPDDPEEGSAEALAKEAADRDRPAEPKAKAKPRKKKSI